MTITQQFCISIFEIIPVESDIVLSSDFEPLLLLIGKMKGSEIDGNYSATFKFTKENKNDFINEVKINNVEEYIHYFQANYKEDIIFIAYDGFQMGTVSNKLNIPINYLEKYSKLGMCIILEKIPDNDGFHI